MFNKTLFDQQQTKVVENVDKKPVPQPGFFKIWRGVLNFSVVSVGGSYEPDLIPCVNRRSSSFQIRSAKRLPGKSVFHCRNVELLRKG